MKKYFITFNGASGTLSSEKHLCDYIRRTFDACVVSESRIGDIKQMIETEQERFLLTHKAARSVDVRIINGYTGTMFINVGQMSICLKEIKKEYL